MVVNLRCPTPPEGLPFIPGIDFLHLSPDPTSNCLVKKWRRLPGFFFKTFTGRDDDVVPKLCDALKISFVQFYPWVTNSAPSKDATSGWTYFLYHQPVPPCWSHWSCCLGVLRLQLWSATTCMSNQVMKPHQCTGCTSSFCFLFPCWGALLVCHCPGHCHRLWTLTLIHQQSLHILTPGSCCNIWSSTWGYGVPTPHSGNQDPSPQALALLSHLFMCLVWS